MRLIICLVLVCLPILFSYAQEKKSCQSATYEALLQEFFPGVDINKPSPPPPNSLKRITADNQTVYTIPVVVHVIYNSNTSNIPDERIFSQIKILNEDYRKFNSDSTNVPAEYKHLAADGKIEFCLATRDPQGNFTNGIVRKRTSQKVFNGYQNVADDTLLKSISRWPTDKYLNIWVTTLPDTTLGYTMNPSSSAINDLNYDPPSHLDGIVINYTVFGQNNRNIVYNKGRTTVHEVGHWLGLRHIWGDYYCGNDFVNDTPVQQGSNIGLKPGDCVHFSNCANKMTKDLSSNFMDYSPDRCMGLFTNGQVNRMRTVLETNPRRKAVVQSSACCKPELVLLPPFFQSFEDTSTIPLIISNPDYDNTWSIHPHGAFSESKKSLMVMNRNNTFSHSDYYITPDIDFRNTRNPVIEFALAAASDLAGQSDSLVISYNSDCAEFKTVASFAKTGLTSFSTSDFVLSDSSWRRVRIPLTGFAGKKIAKLRVENYSNGIHPLYIDDINIFDASESLEILLYPVPAEEELNILMKNKEVLPMDLAIYTTMGQLKETRHFQDQNFNKKMILSNYAPGLYIVKIQIKGSTVYKRFVVSGI